MPKVTTYNGLINRISNGFVKNQPIWGEAQTAGATLGGNTTPMLRTGWTMTLPTPLPTDVSQYLATYITAASNLATSSTLVAKLVNLGSLDIATPTFTDGAAMPTVTELGVSRQVSGPIFIEVTTVLNAAPGSITVTYVDQDGNAAETTAAQALGASAPVRSSGFIQLNTPDIGARDITTATRTGGTTPTGVIRFWGIIPISIVETDWVAGVPGADNLLTAGFCYSPLGAGDTVGLFALGSTVRALTGNITFIGDST